MTEIESLGIWGHTTQGINDGFGYAGYKMCQALNALGYKTLWEDTKSPIALSFTQPYAYGGRRSQYKIGYTPWESTELPESWIEPMNSRDEIWTTSNFCKEVFEANGIERPISVVHHGIDPAEWTLHRRIEDEYFIFFHMGEPAERKNGQMVFDAFKKCFGNNKNVYLYMKAHSWFEARWMEGTEVVGPIDSYPNVVANKKVLSKEKLDKLYNSVHCMLYPSNGEGFGLIPFQGIATGLPTVFPAWGGLADFKDYGIPMDYTVGPSNHDYHIGDWAWPSFDDLCDKMVEVYENYQPIADKAYTSGVELRENYSWDAVMTRAAKLLSDLPVP